MENLELIRSLKIPADTKIVMLVADGIGGLPIEEGGPTELEAASTPNSYLARKGSVHSIPIRPGFKTAGPALGLFGYDPLKARWGVLEPPGSDSVGPNMSPSAATSAIDAQGRMRTAGRVASPPTMLRRLHQVSIPGVGSSSSRSEHRFVVIFRGEARRRRGDTDPQKRACPRSIRCRPTRR